MPGATYVSARPVFVPARLLGNVLIVEAKYDKFGPYHFVIDTGSSVTLVSPELASRYQLAEAPPGRHPQGARPLLGGRFGPPRRGLSQQASARERAVRVGAGARL